MKDYAFVIYLIAPLIGYILGSVKPLRFINNRTACFTFLVVSALCLFSFFTKISLALDWIDHTIIVIGLLAIGYCGTRIMDPASGLHPYIIRVFRTLTIGFYIVLPVLFYGFLVMSFGNDHLGKTVHIDEYQNYRIKHVNINSNFNFPGNHFVTVYNKTWLIEYPVKKLNLGTYGQYGFNVYTVLDDKTMVPENAFDYDEVSQSLILLRYNNGLYTKSKLFKNP